MAGWSIPENVLTIRINNTPEIISGSQDTCYIDSIRLVNRTFSNIFATIFVKEETEDLIIKDCLIDNEILIPPKRNEHGGVTLISTRDILILKPGDLLFAHSDSSANFFDCAVMRRRLTQPTS